MHHRQAGFNSRKMCYAGKIHDFLDTAAAEHAPASITAAHDIGMIPENRKGMRPYGAGSYMEYSRFACCGNTVHDRNHEHQALGSRIGSTQRTCFNEAVQGADSPGFSLHFHNPDRLAEEVLFTMSGPYIHVFRHRGRRSNRENCCNFCQCIRYICGSFVTIHCFHQFFCHFKHLLEK